MNTVTGLAPLDTTNLAPYIAWSEDRRRLEGAPAASVVIVAYNTNQQLIECLESLGGQSEPNFEIVLVDNGQNEQVLEAIRKFPLLYIALKDNYRPSLARNIGIVHSRAKVVCFLDDDALAHPDFVKSHLAAHASPGIMGARGKVLPKSQSLYNSLALIYNLGNTVVPSYIDLEGNASFSRQALMAVGGFNPQVFAGEGAELSYRIVKCFGNPHDLVYWPDAIIYHNYANNLIKYMRKARRDARMSIYIRQMYPDYHAFIESYHPFPAGDIPKARNLWERIELALIRRMIRLVKKWETIRL